MNYAEDRLDRRAAGSTIAADLDAAHAALREAGDALLSLLPARVCAAANDSASEGDTTSQQHHDEHVFDLSSPEIVRILHTAMDFPSHLKGNE